MRMFAFAAFAVLTASNTLAALRIEMPDSAPVGAHAYAFKLTGVK
jgi:hypothetical protein